MAQTIPVDDSVLSLMTVGSTEAFQRGLTPFEQAIYVDDLANTFMNISEFGRTIKYYHSQSKIWLTYNIIFDDPHASVSINSGGEFNSLRPQFQIAESSLKYGILKNDRCTVGGIDYLIDDFISDGVGVTTVYLRVK